MSVNEDRPAARRRFNASGVLALVVALALIGAALAFVGHLWVATILATIADGATP